MPRDHRPARSVRVLLAEDGSVGRGALAVLLQLAPDCRVLILATAARPGLLERALAAGAAGFLIKDGPVNDLVTAVRQVLTGETVVDPALTPSGAYGSMVRPQGRTTEGPPCPP
jgi:DNA-binding NarL/FixJ family response regulator